MKPVVAIDLGGTRVKAGIVRDGRVIASTVTHLVPGDKTPDRIITRLAEVVAECLDHAGLYAKGVEGVGIGSAGAVRRSTGVVTLSPQFPLWRELPLAALLGERVGLPVTIDNDANAITLGEAAYGAGRGVGDFVCLTLGSGVGTGLFLNGDVYRGADGMAGEVGHSTVEPEGFPCNCGGRGCLEQYASATGLRNLVRRDRLFGDMTEAALEDPHLPERLFEAARAGDPRCIGYFDQFGYRLAIAIANVLHVLNVHTIVLAGGLARAYDAFAPRLLRELPTRGYPAILGPVNVVLCELWEDGGVLGAAALVAGTRRKG